MLFKKYRPDDWFAVVGHRRVKTVIHRKSEAGTLGGSAFYISGASGSGKSTIARLISLEIADEINVDDIDASGLTAAGVRDMERSWKCTAIGKKRGRAYTINECHALRSDAITQLLVTLERIPRHVVVVFTTTLEGQQKLFSGIDSFPLVSRCIEFRLQPNAAAFAQRAQEIAEAEGLGGAMPAEYADLVKRCQCNLRKVLCEIEAGAMIREGVFA